jgi:hypothetical protein
MNARSSPMPTPHSWMALVAATFVGCAPSGMAAHAAAPVPSSAVNGSPTAHAVPPAPSRSGQPPARAPGGDPGLAAASRWASRRLDTQADAAIVGSRPRLLGSRAEVPRWRTPGRQGKAAEPPSNVRPRGSRRTIPVPDNPDTCDVRRRRRCACAGEESDGCRARRRVFSNSTPAMSRSMRTPPRTRRRRAQRPRPKSHSGIMRMAYRHRPDPPVPLDEEPGTSDRLRRGASAAPPPWPRSASRLPFE